jgi:predicted nucleic acid-binding protein
VTRFFDTKILVYAYCEEPRTSIARALLSEVPTKGGVISVQILTELANVLLRKFNLPWNEIERALDRRASFMKHVRSISHFKKEHTCRENLSQILRAML